MKMSSFRMKEGLGEKSYAQNSSFQREAAGLVRHLVVESAVEAYDCFVASALAEQLAIADLGCATGSNSLSLMAAIVEAIAARSCELQAAARGSSSPTPLIKPPEITVFFNDLPSNDFNALFASFPEFSEKMRRSCFSPSAGHHPAMAATSPPQPRVFMAAAPGSFYGRLFPKSSLLFIHSSFSLHWLSEVPAGLEDDNGKPINKGTILATNRSPPSVVAAYTNQFCADFRMFLESRSHELVPGSGRMALVFLARKQRCLGYRTDLFTHNISRALAIMASQKEIELEKADSFNLPVFFPCMEEVEEMVEEEGSFEVAKMELHAPPYPIKDGEDVVDSMVKIVRVLYEPLLADHLGSTECVDRLLGLFNKLLLGEIGDDDVEDEEDEGHGGAADAPPWLNGENPGLMLLVLKKLP